MADVRDGVGPFLAVYLKAGQHWQSGPIGLAMATSGVVAALCQVPAGLLVDATRFKRGLVALSGLLVALGCLSIALVPSMWMVIAAQATLGAASAIIPPALAALSLGVVGRVLLPARISRNECFNHAGNLTAAALAGLLGQLLGLRWIFYLVCVFALGSALVVRLIDPREIDHELARGGERHAQGGAAVALPIAELLRRRDLQIFILCVVMFHAGNAAMLPLAGQMLAQTHPGTDAAALSACIIAAQLTMVGVAWCVGRAMRDGIGRKPIFLIAFAVLPVRGVLFTLISNPFGIVGIQVLDGVAAGIFGVISVIIASDLTRGTGRFNLAQGLTALATGIGAGLSNIGAGYVVQGFGYPVGFLTLTGIALIGLVLFVVCMPETGTPDKPRPEAPNATGGSSAKVMI